MKKSGALPLLVEIGCEEIPARFVAGAARQFGERLRSALEAARLLDPQPQGTHEDVGASTSVYWTPRRLVAHVSGLCPVQPDRVDEITGPPVRVAFDAQGHPTRAAESFAEKNEVPINALFRKTTPKGEYLAARRTESGRPAHDLLSAIIPTAALELDWPKSMVWLGKQGPRFIRPIRWVTAVLGEGKSASVVPFEVAGVRAGNGTFGHRSYSRHAISVTGFKDYRTKLAKARVEIGPEERRARFKAQVKLLLETKNLRVPEDRELEDWVVNSVEWPHAILGEFDPRFLALPREILIAVMRGHQKYFAVEDSTGKLEPRFVTILNREDDPKGLIRAGHERVLRARFTDAEFFWDTDQKAPLRDRMPLLERVTYHEKLGSYAAKVRRVEQIAKAIADLWVNQGLISEDKIELISAAVRLSKCDLTTQMVQEFPELQGVVGGLYAQAQAEPQEVADAVYDHYRPAGLQDEGPRSPIGRAASLADKIDAVSSGFAVGLAPSGSSDPFGLRKQASGVIKALLASEISLDLKPLIRAAINGLNKPDLSSETSKLLSVMSGVADFFRERVAYYLDSVDGIRYDTIRAAVLASGEPNVWNVFGDDPLNIRERAVQCERNRNDARFLSLCAAAKRIRNILTKSAAGSEALGDAFKMELFEKDEERLLANALTDVVPQAKDLARKREFGRALLTISELSQPVDRFFDSVMVMVEDVKVRENRLRMLNYLNGVCGAIVDFSQIVAEEASVSAAPKAKGSTALERDAEH